MAPLKILLVDDNRDLADGLALILEDEDHEVAVAYDGQGAISQGREADFDVIFMDFKLPDVHGIEALLEIRKTKPHARVLLMTGCRVDQVAEQLVDRGRVCTLARPFTAERMSAAVELVAPEGIVVVDAEAGEALEELESLLAGQGYRTLVLNTANQAVDLARDRHFDVLLLDLGRPLVEALAVYVDLKTHHGAVTTFAVVRRCEDEGRTVNVLHSTRATGCLFKPFDPGDMVALAREVAGAPADLSRRARRSPGP